jgi:hypothetical protein
VFTSFCRQWDSNPRTGFYVNPLVTAVVPHVCVTSKSKRDLLFSLGIEPNTFRSRHTGVLSSDNFSCGKPRGTVTVLQKVVRGKRPAVSRI